jgi:hypothetical protein
VFGPVVGAFVIIAMQQYLAGFGQWVTVIQGVIFRGLRADLPPRRDRRDRALFPPFPVSGTKFGTLPCLTKQWMTRFDSRRPRAFPEKWFMTVM